MELSHYRMVENAPPVPGRFVEKGIADQNCSASVSPASINTALDISLEASETLALSIFQRASWAFCRLNVNAIPSIS
ncbi:hypothetical protein JXA32_07125 [Candidatus Sumerlaeota bacterium]|nr:hypothetical protein [Candidatus Sumerlaeota bacterium]